MTDTSSSSQIKLLPDSLKNKINIISKPSISQSNTVDIAVNKVLRDNKKSVLQKLKDIKSLNTSTKSRRVQQEVARFILDIHVYKPFFLNFGNIYLYSEEDFKVKFWLHVIEELFSISDVCLHWGDTVPNTFKKESASPKVDIRIISGLNSKDNDYSLGEFAKIANGAKLYNDKTKLVLMAKKHLNSLIKEGIFCQYPFIMVMRFDFAFMTIEYINDIGYVIQEVNQTQFPITKNATKEGGLQAIINSINSVKNHVFTLKEKREDRIKEKATNKIKQLTRGPRTYIATDNITPVFWQTSKDGLFLSDTDSDTDSEVTGRQPFYM